MAAGRRSSWGSTKWAPARGIVLADLAAWEETTVESHAEWFAPLRKAVTIRRRTAKEAFEVFTTGMAR